MELRIKEITYSVSSIVKAEWVFEEGEQDVEIIFDDLQTELLDTVDCYDKTYLAIGYDKEGNKYSASAVYSCDELVELDDIVIEEFAGEKEARAEYDRKKANGDFEPENMGLTGDERYIKLYNEKRQWRHGLNPLNY